MGHPVRVGGRGSVILCALADLPKKGAKGPFRLTINGQVEAVFVVRQGPSVTAFVDRCPHVGAPLEMEPDHFLDLSKTEILCSLHGARFDPATGLCRLGPCKGRSLVAVPVSIEDGMVVAPE
ncbi:MAG: Rieske 2Fe-2S domain-containing protein [Alphaproteobacteria bacterium]|nr:Rieske 2Fe-2S domain-containing protein [Alphaproteobacteria bacterium]